MRPTKLLGALFLLAGLFTVTRGQGWQFGYIVTGLALAFVGLLLTTRLQTRRLPAASAVRRARPLNLARKVRARA